MEGERVACGTAHADNVSPVLLGGFTLVRSANPLDVVTLNSPLELVVTIIHPEIEVKTADARAVLLDKLHLKQAIAQTANLGALVTGLFKEDYELIRRSLVDHIVEPVRSMLIPGFNELKNRANEAGALGTGISGSGPSVFALSKGMDIAQKDWQCKKSMMKSSSLRYSYKFYQFERRKNTVIKMQYFSLNNNSKAVGFENAVRLGLAPDRGLYILNKSIH